MTKKQVDDLLTDVSVLQEIIPDNYDGPYGLGIHSYSNDDGHPELHLHVDSDEGLVIPDSIERHGQKVVIKVKTGFKQPVAYGK